MKNESLIIENILKLLGKKELLKEKR